MPPIGTVVIRTGTGPLAGRRGVVSGHVEASRTFREGVRVDWADGGSVTFGWPTLLLDVAK